MEKKISLWRLMYGVLWGSPVKTLEYIAERPAFWSAAALITILNLLLTMPLLPKIQEASVWAMQSMPGAVKLSAAQIDAYARMVTYASAAAAILLPMLIWVVSAALLKLFNSFTGEKASFSTLFAISVFAYLPAVLESLIKTPIMLATEAQKMTRITISPALLLPPPEGLSPGRLYTFLSQLDPFMIWALALTALGTSIAIKVPFRRAAAYIGALWLVFVFTVSFLARSQGA